MKKVISGFSGNGIYTITSPSNKVYIGQSWNLHDRWLDYKRGYCNKQPKIGASLKKYGFENHKFEVIFQLTEDINQNWMDYWEKFFINYFREAGCELMNIREGGSRGKLSEETKDKLRIIHTGRKCSEEFKRKISLLTKGENNPRFGIRGVENSTSKPVSQFTKQGILVKEWFCIKDVSREVRIDAGSITKTCQGLRKSAGGFKWKYKEG